MVNTSANIQGGIQSEGLISGDSQKAIQGSGKSDRITKSEYERVFNELAAFLYKQYKNRKQREQIDETLEKGTARTECC